MSDTIALPSRYESLDPAFKSNLRPNANIIEAVNQCYNSMRVSGGIRFLPIYGESGAGKTSATMELGTHLPDVLVVKITIDSLTNKQSIINTVERERHSNPNKLVIALIDQQEEKTASKEDIPTIFVEVISSLDRNEFKDTPVLFIWLTTSLEFQQDLVNAVRRNKRLIPRGYKELSIEGPPKHEWLDIIEETFSFHNNEKRLADFDVIEEDILKIIDDPEIVTIGEAIDCIGSEVGKYQLTNLSEYTVVMLWPVTKMSKVELVRGFTDPRMGYKLDWKSWYRSLNSADQKALPLTEYNKARLYFDVRLIPIAAADLHKLCKKLDEPEITLHKTYVEWFEKTHFFNIITEQWDPNSYSPMREREESQRSKDADTWYQTITNKPTQVGRRIAQVMRENGYSANHEQTINNNNVNVRADVLISSELNESNYIIELKLFSTSNTISSKIRDAIRETLRRHAQLAGFLQKQ